MELLSCYPLQLWLTSDLLAMDRSHIQKLNNDQLDQKRPFWLVFEPFWYLQGTKSNKNNRNEKLTSLFILKITNKNQVWNTNSLKTLFLKFIYFVRVSRTKQEVQGRLIWSLLRIRCYWRIQHLRFSSLSIQRSNCVWQGQCKRLSFEWICSVSMYLVLPVFGRRYRPAQVLE